MSKSRKKPRRSEPVFRNPNSGDIRPARLERTEMSESGGKIEISALTFRQQAALPIIAASPTLSDAARDSGIGESTLRRWLEAPAFRDELDRFRHETADLARQELQGLMLRSLSVLAEAMEAPDLAIRLRAARYAMTFAFQASEFQKLRAEIQKLEAAIASHQPGTPSTEA